MGPIPSFEAPQASEQRRAASAPATPVDRLALAIATGAGTGYAPVAPGTVGSAATLVLYWPLAALSAPAYLALVAGVTALGIWAAGRAERIFARKDDGRIVIDEVAGQLVTLAPLVALAPPGARRDPLWLVTGFVVFRLLDIWKPGPVRMAERRFPGGAGVVLDDVVAGAIGAGVLAAALWGLR